ncbi:MAG: hypothetical protein WCV85_04995 [Patescibacteria group bacterium]
MHIKKRITDFRTIVFIAFTLTWATSFQFVSAGSIGSKVSDGTIIAGISPETGKLFYVLPVDLPSTMEWEAAMSYATHFNGLDHLDGSFRIPDEVPSVTVEFRLPTRSELRVMYENRAIIGGFSDAGEYEPTGRYWSSTQDNNDPTFAWAHVFDTEGINEWAYKSGHGQAAVRLIHD